MGWWSYLRFVLLETPFTVLEEKPQVEKKWEEGEEKHQDQLLPDALLRTRETIKHETSF